MKRNSTMINAERVALSRVRYADSLHDEEMAQVCKRGGKTLAQMRRMSMGAKDEFIFRHRTRKPSEAAQ